MNIFWFKRDLRILDNPALAKAIQESDELIFIYIFEPALLQDHHYHPRHWRFVEASLFDLQEKLDKHELKLHVLHGDCMDVFKRLIADADVKRVYSTEETGIRITYDRDLQLQKFFHQKGIQWIETQNNGVIRGIKDRSTWRKDWHNYMSKPLVHPDLAKVKAANYMPSVDEWTYQSMPKTNEEIEQVGGENQGLQRLSEFADGPIINYHKHISKPGESRVSCSRLSTYLAWGNISVRYVYQYIKNKKELERKAYSRALLDRLRWHCHFIQKFEMEDRMEFANINRGYDAIRTTTDKEKLAAYEAGRTGYPLVDACIRCLKATGYINFRMRAMLVSFATHHLWLPWQSIAPFLARNFLDFEPGIHYPQIQMQASTTGTNTIRIYKPVKQSKDHDPDGLFIREWVSELQDCPVDYIHEPWTIPPIIADSAGFKPGHSYAKPIVNISETYRQARDQLWQRRKDDLTKREAARILKKHTIPRVSSSKK